MEQTENELQIKLEKMEETKTNENKYQRLTAYELNEAAATDP